MRAVILFFLFVFGLVSSFMLLASDAYAGKTENKVINDSLVQDLSCKHLSVDSIYKSIREDAFDQTRNIPIVNWSYKDGVARLANCWSLSRTQRMFSYLARYSTPAIVPLEKRVALVLDMIRGARMVKKGKEKPLSKYQVFEVEEDNFRDSRKAIYWSLWKGVFYGYLQYFGSKKEFVSRKLEYEIEAYQSNRFFKAKNFGFILNGGERSQKNNLKTMEALKKNLDGKRLTLLNLRLGRANQHIVMAKSYYQYADGTYEITVYDSNFPREDSMVYFDPRNGEFTAPRIVNRIAFDDADRALGVFIIDEDDRKVYETAMLEHYRSACR